MERSTVCGRQVLVRLLLCYTVTMANETTTLIDPLITSDPDRLGGTKYRCTKLGSNRGLFGKGYNDAEC